MEILKICKIHGQLSNNEFYNVKRGSGCKKCHASRKLKYVNSNKEKIAASNKIYYEKIGKASQKIWISKNKEKVNISQKRYRLLHRDTLNERGFLRRKKSICDMDDYYIKRLLCDGGIIGSNNIPIPLIEAKREHLKLTRMIREIKKAKND